MKAGKKPRGIRKPKGYAPGEPYKNIYIASHGNISGDAALVYDRLQFFFELRPARGEYNTPLMKAMGHTKKTVDKIPSELGLMLVNELDQAIANEDGSFFADLAKLCARGQQNDPLRSWLIVMHFHAGKGLATGEQDALYTANQLFELAKKRGVAGGIEIRYLHQVCKELGIKLMPDQRGRKKN